MTSQSPGEHGDRKEFYKKPHLHRHIISIFYFSIHSPTEYQTPPPTNFKAINMSNPGNVVGTSSLPDDPVCPELH